MKKLIIAIVSIWTFFDLDAQQSASLLVQKFNTYQTALPKTKLHLIFNQDKFSSGDTAYFKAYFLKEDMSGIDGKQLIELNLVDSKGESKLRFSFTVTNGVGQNQMAIPPVLPAGIYLITAHSSWMKNFTPLPFFKKEIEIVNKNVILANEKQVAKAVVEGGHLITGVENKVVINTYSAGSSVKIVDDSGREIDKTNSDSNGIGSIILKPLFNVSYFVRVADDSIKTPLPGVENDGCNLSLIAFQKNEPIKVVIQSPHGATIHREELAIMLSSHGKIYHSSSFLMGSKDFVELQLPQTSLPNGIAHVSLLKPDGTLIASRDFYHQEEGEAKAKIQIEKKYLRPREKARIEVSLTDKDGQPIEGEFSIKAINTELFDTEKQNSLSDELSILSGLPEKYLIDRSDPNWLNNLDNYLILVTEEVPWKEMLSNATVKPRYAFSNFIQKSGRAYFAETQEPVPDFTDIMFYLQRSKIRYQTVTEKGKVWLSIPDLFGQDELFYFGETFFYAGGEKHGETIPNLKIEWDDESIQLPHAVASIETGNADRYASFANKLRLIDRSYGFFTSRQGVQSDHGRIAKESDFESEVNGPDVTINVQNYIVFPTMTELVKEVIPSLQHRKRNGKDMVLVTLSEGMSAMSSGDPLYVIDGIATKNTEFFLGLKPIDLLTVKIIFDPNKLLRLGLLGKNGIVIIDTKNGDARESVDPSKLVEGLNRPVNFKTTDHAVAKYPRRPDFRSTLYWNPTIKTDSKGKATIEFFCSDDIGPINIRIDGLTKDRKPFSAENQFEVTGNAGK